jgi:3-oxoacyl-[acyl-carrier protein] reductase
MKFVISGGSKGLGADLADYLAPNHQVVTFSRGTRGNLHPNITHIPDIDASKAEDLDKLVPYLADTDGIVNNVGMAYDGILATQGPDSIKQVLDINIFSALYLTKLYLRNRLVTKKGGSVVSISSIVSIRGFSGLAAYSATKGAVNSMTRSLAREMGERGFRFNAVLPGYFLSDLSKGMPDKQKEKIVRRTPMGRLAETSDICPLIEFLLSDGSKFITGQEIAVDGGLTA